MSAARPSIPVGRLAPSPTGAQHVGNARTYLLAWLSIRSRGGRLILRIEDIDSPRVKPWAIQQAIDDLAWLGLDWDEGPDLGGPNAPYVQTERLERYREAFAQLQRAERVYPCTCSRSDVLAAASAPHEGDEGPIYPGVCSGRNVADHATLADRPYCWRFRSTAVRDHYDDMIRGRQVAAGPTGDFVIWKTSHTPAYQLAVVVDDAAMGVTEVIRGDDLVPSTFRQLELYDYFGWTPPAFGHAPLVVGPDGRRLAKRHGDTRLSALRDAGIKPEALLGLLAWSLGLISRNEPISAAELLNGDRGSGTGERGEDASRHPAPLDLTAIHRTAFVLTADDLRSIGY